MRFAVVALAVLAAAPLAAQETPTTTTPSVIVLHERSPAAAGIFSFLIPGAGQVYNGQVGKGLAFFGAELVELALAARVDCSEIGYYDRFGNWILTSASCETPSSTPAWLGAMVATHVWSIVHAVKTSKRLNAEARAKVELRPAVQADGRVGLAASVVLP